MRRSGFAAVLISLGAAAALAAQGIVVAEVAGRPITRDQFRSWLQVLRTQPQYAQSVETVTPGGQRQILDRLVTQRLFAEAARERGVDRDPQVAFLIEQQTAATLAERYEQQLLAQAGEADLRKYFDSHADLFRSGKRVKASHILAKSHDVAAQVLADLRAGNPFGEVARLRSADAGTASAGGDLGWVPRGVMVKPFEDALFALPAGAVSGIVQTGYGFHVLKASEVDEGTLLPFDAVKDIVRRSMAADRVAAERERLAARYGARVFPERLNEEAR